MQAIGRDIELAPCDCEMRDLLALPISEPAQDTEVVARAEKAEQERDDFKANAEALSIERECLEERTRALESLLGFVVAFVERDPFSAALNGLRPTVAEARKLLGTEPGKEQG